MIRINLIPTKAERKKEGAIFQLIAGVIVIAVALVICWWKNREMEKRVESERIVQNDLQQKINQLQAVIAEVEDYKRKRRDLEAKINTIKDLNEKRTGPVKFMEEFGYVLPRKAWITTFREMEKQLTLEGAAADGPTVADFIDNLRGSKFFYNVQLIQVSQGGEGGRTIQKFSVNCLVNYNPGGAKS
ncbi:MAG: PilN domain-containing protein [Pseudomonadota bacterium]